MKKKNLKNLNLKKQSIADFTKNELNGGTSLTVYSCVFCPTITCTQGDICDVLISYALDDIRICIE